MLNKRLLRRVVIKVRRATHQEVANVLDATFMDHIEIISYNGLPKDHRDNHDTLVKSGRERAAIFVNIIYKP